MVVVILSLTFHLSCRASREDHSPCTQSPALVCPRDQDLQRTKPIYLVYLVFFCFMFREHNLQLAACMVLIVQQLAPDITMMSDLQLTPWQRCSSEIIITQFWAMARLSRVTCHVSGVTSSLAPSRNVTLTANCRTELSWGSCGCCCCGLTGDGRTLDQEVNITSPVTLTTLHCIAVYMAVTTYNCSFIFLTIDHCQFSIHLTLVCHFMNGAVLAGPRTLGSWCWLGGGAGPATISMVGTGGGVKVQQPAHIRCCALSSNTKLLCNQYSANIMMFLYRLWNMEAYSLQEQYLLL